MIQSDCILYVLAATDCSQALFPIYCDYSSTLPLKCLQIWICVSVCVSSSGAQCVTQFASGFTMIDWLFEFTLSLNEDWGPVTITQLLFTVHKRAGIWNTSLTLLLCHVRANKSFVHIIIDFRVLQPFLSRQRECDLTWQIQLILKSTYCEMASVLGAGGKALLRSRDVS